MRVQTGAHTASTNHAKLAKTDVGVGYVYERTEAAQQPAALATRPLPEKPDDPNEAHGVYAEFSRAIVSRRHHRAWLGLRSELLWREQGLGDRHKSLGVATRMSWELFGRSDGSGSKSTDCGFVAATWTGTTALGLFVETGARTVEGRPTELVATAGATIRFPFIMGMGMDLCSWCK